jgi:EAL domain-containing protein (putative c-di-GMP-specific phosphodiesterase class I)
LAVIPKRAPGLYHPQYGRNRLHARTHAKGWQEARIEFGHVAVNLSGVQIQHAAFVESVKRILEETGLAARYLELEITENILMRDVEASAKYLQDLRQLGVSISIDDLQTDVA